MAHHHSVGLKSVITAILGNTMVGILKFVGFFVTGSSVMLSEGIHSIADTANQSLLFLGIKRSEKPADEKFHYGYAQERFFWALISACGIFFLGAGVTTYHGIEVLRHPIHTEPSMWVFIILALSFILEGYALVTALKEAKRMAGNEKLFKHLNHSGDPTILAVIYEDSAALAGIVIALIATVLTNLSGNPVWDGIGSVLVGVLLGWVALSLISINRRFLLNKSVPHHVREKIMDVLKSQDIVEEVHDLKTVMIGTDGYIIKAEIEINGHVLAEKIFDTENMKVVYEDMENYTDFLKHTHEMIDQTTRLLGREIDRIETEITKEIPNIKHIDIEAN
jgi:zinc transporter 9